jgi:hypothetical protein
MGYNHYLRRDDNRTLFELGKWLGEEWMEALGGGAPIVHGPEDEAALIAALTPDIATWGTLTPEFDGAEDYARFVAKAIITWCDGQPFRFVGEDGFDRWAMDDTWDKDQAVTGSRYTNSPGSQSD